MIRTVVEFCTYGAADDVRKYLHETRHVSLLMCDDLSPHDSRRYGLCCVVSVCRIVADVHL